MPTPSSYIIWLIGPDSYYVTRLCHRLCLNPDYQVRRFTSVAAALAARPSPGSPLPNALVLDSDDAAQQLPQRLLAKLRERLPEAPLFVLADQANATLEAQLLSQGITAYLVKDAGSPERLWQALAKTREPQPTPPPADSPASHLLLGEHPTILRVRELITKAARTSITVSVSGETGTGKEVVAQAIHAQSSRVGKPFVALNMAAIPRELLESELFGHEKGAFTGAASRRTGRFEEASGGTLFLDEIADLELTLQAKLLRVLQERTITRVGGRDAIPFDVRLVVATHRDLAAEVRAGRFREDLYYRLLGLPIELPPLRSRGQDVLLLATAFERAFSQQNGLPSRPFSKEARQALLNYAFPGNVRELKAVVELATVLAEGAQLEAADLPFRNLAPVADGPAPKGQHPSLREQTLAIMQQSLNDMQGDVVAAAGRLRVGRSTLYRLIQSGELRLPTSAT
ncbi:sigma-54-dependent Fis family transcriptional regulator [Hymenobacter sp. RP-2-7]|uniref:Sigma-54-dependent Fis family transcriptional regulator n=1 Tax=Hymenobacter polaris TaxID=2682546 RepID=A0A7Y0AGB7_9BACT|nr:sigma-54 dependent transcriptional regulator [Hymenobacter polaris]NML66831.1 sigma-54-dependent Fis family transcriptional regulator [Hymenobacter polaris]